MLERPRNNWLPIYGPIILQYKNAFNDHQLSASDFAKVEMNFGDRKSLENRPSCPPY